MSGYNLKRCKMEIKVIRNNKWSLKEKKVFLLYFFIYFYDKLLKLMFR